MSKTQRSRLAALLAKDQATLSADEKTELANLQALAAQHPDASKDTDEPAAAAAPAPAATATGTTPTASTFKTALIGALSTLRDKAAIGTDLATARAELTQARADLATRTTELTQARSDIATAQAQVTSLSAQLGTFAAYFGLTVADLVGKDAATVTGLLATKISAEATEQIASLGVPVGQLPQQTAGNGGGAAETLEELQAQMKDEKDPKKLGQLAARANALREKLWAAGAN